VRFALAQVDPVVGDLQGNAALAAACVAKAAASQARVIVFPELLISGYPPEDLLLKDHFLDDCRTALEVVTAATAGTDVIAIIGVPLRTGTRVGNAAAVLAGGRLQATYEKISLPNYAVFDEQRYFDPGRRILILELEGVRLAVNVCEDIWDRPGPSEEAALIGGADVVVNLSMSPYHWGKGDEREAMLARRAADAGAFILYCNGVGGQDELVFDGQSLAFGPDGRLLARGPQFEECLLMVDLDPAETQSVRGEGQAAGLWPLELVPLEQGMAAAGSPEPAVAAAPPGADPWPPAAAPAEPTQSGGPATVREVPVVWDAVARALDYPAEVYGALVLGVRDYVSKNGFEHVVIGLSGGIDSALTACIAVDALGADRVTAVSMPSPYSSLGTQQDAREMAGRLQVQFLELPIEEIYGTYLEVLAGPFAELASDVTEENLQARVRGNLLMALSNKFGWLVLTTGNKSEVAVGYSTLYGDMAGGFAVIKDVPKTLVYRLSIWRNAQGQGEGEGPIPPSIITRPPSAELRPHQTDQDTLPPYELLDAIIEAYVVRDRSVDEMVADGLDRSKVERIVAMVDQNEYKRRQAAPGPRITSKAFGKDRRLPITNRYRG